MARKRKLARGVAVVGGGHAAAEGEDEGEEPERGGRGQ